MKNILKNLEKHDSEISYFFLNIFSEYFIELNLCCIFAVTKQYDYGKTSMNNTKTKDVLELDMIMSFRERRVQYEKCFLS